MKYIPETRTRNEQDAEQNSETLFERAIPSHITLAKRGSLLGFAPYSEIELRRLFKRLAAGNGAADFLCFLGAGAYDHYIPSIVDNLSSRSEFMTSYTQYQPELSQGMLQILFEYQTMMAELLQMDVVNTSMYDGASALAEAALMAVRVTKGLKSRILVSSAINPLYKDVLQTYLVRGAGLVLEYLGQGDDGRTDTQGCQNLKKDNDVACVILQSPNFFGVIESLHGLSDIIHSKGVLFVLSINPTSLGLLKSPGAFDCDIATGEAQSLGIPLSFGGPYGGFFATKKSYVRQMPGRLVGETVDVEGKRAYTLTLATREQHIRRYHATSNICTNQALCAVRAAIYLAVMGEKGIREVASQSKSKAQYLAEKICELTHFRLRYHTPFFNEFLVETDVPMRKVQEHLESRGVLVFFGWPSIPLPGRTFLIAVTEKRSRQELDYVAQSLKEIDYAHTSV